MPWDGRTELAGRLCELGVFRVPFVCGPVLLLRPFCVFVTHAASVLCALLPGPCLRAYWHDHRDMPHCYRLRALTNNASFDVVSFVCWLVVLFAWPFVFHL